MRILLLPFIWWPDPVGGTEVYVSDLAQGLKKAGLTPIIAAPCDRDFEQYEHDGMQVWRFPAPQHIDLEQIYRRQVAHFGAVVRRILDETKPDIVHLHGYTAALCAEWLIEAKRRRIATVFTYHVPTVSCLRNDMMVMGETLCDGAIVVNRCATCILSRDLPHAVAASIANVAELPMGVAKRLGSLGRMLGAKNLVRAHAVGVTELLSAADRIVAVCSWVHRVLVNIGAQPQQLRLNRQGTRADQGEKLPVPGDKLRLMFMGRGDRLKGLDVLLQALLQEPSLNLSFEALVVVQQDQEKLDFEKWSMQIANDARITMTKNASREQVYEALGRSNMVAVPSQGAETGPLVVLEAFDKGRPVLGSDHGGIAELVRNGIDGMLVPAKNIKAWRAALRHLSEQPEHFLALAANVPEPRRMARVAEEHVSYYAELLSDVIKQEPGP